ncbi:MAG TPA: alpha/beta hydrolase [Burkholderiaceae bacterium]|nr:alpha/beta hydrolase [Burkholderiaceae bacterium]
MITTDQYAQLASGIRLHYASAGERGRPLVLCVHGFPEYWGAWEEVLPRLGEWAYAVAPDLRGFNLSSQPRAVEAYRAREIVGDLLGLMEVLGYARAFVLAHDWGGAAAWQLAIAHPQRVEKLAILNSPHPVPFARELAHNPEQQKASTYMNWLRRPEAERKLAENDFARLVGFLADAEGRAPAWLDQARLARYREVWARGLTGGVNYYRATPLVPPTADEPGASAVRLDPAQFTVRVPTLVLWGMKDRALLPCLLDGLVDVVPDLRLQRLPQATHWLAHEVPELIAAEATAFFRG